MAAAHRVVMDTLCIQLGLIHCLTLLSRRHSPSLSIVDEFNLHQVISQQKKKQKQKHHCNSFCKGGFYIENYQTNCCHSAQYTRIHFLQRSSQYTCNAAMLAASKSPLVYIYVTSPGKEAHSNPQNVVLFYLFSLHFMICTIYFVVLKYNCQT